MPRSVVGIKAQMRDHSISIPTPENTEPFSMPNACNLCREDETPAWAVATLEEWFPESRSRDKLIRRTETFTAAALLLRARMPATDEAMRATNFA